jgi:5'-nucleotidase / UDP-sugar diphosphatase
VSRSSRVTVVACVVLAVATLGLAGQANDVTILYTNDFHSAIDPIPAYWLPGSPNLGGAAQLATLVRTVREKEPGAFLFDSGDLFTGTLSFLTRGKALVEMTNAMGYDAFAVGNHEFDYGAANCERQMSLASFPTLAANIYYKGTKHRFTRPWAIVERRGVRVGVIGVIGLDARSVALPAGIVDLEFTDPVEAVRAGVKELEGSVDLVVVLAHQGKTGPEESDAEFRPEVQRDVEEDVRLASAVPGIAVLIGGHAHRGLETPIVAPGTGTLVVQTYGYGTRLGYLTLRVQDGRVASYDGYLMHVWSEALEPDPVVTARLAPYRALLEREAGQVVGHADVRLVRDYVRESPLGDFVADVMRSSTGAELAFENAGGLRADLPAGDVTRAHVLDALPFDNSVVTLTLSGRQVRALLEQSLSLERGMMQVSGLKVTYDLSRAVGSRLVKAEVGGHALEDARDYRVATNSFLAQGGDLYQTFLEGRDVKDGQVLLSTVVVDHLRKGVTARIPQAGRLVSANPAQSPSAF